MFLFDILVCWFQLFVWRMLPLPGLSVLNLLIVYLPVISSISDIFFVYDTTGKTLINLMKYAQYFVDKFEKGKWSSFEQKCTQLKFYNMADMSPTLYLINYLKKYFKIQNPILCSYVDPSMPIGVWQYIWISNATC